mgnify:CR=1 FL=1
MITAFYDRLSRIQERGREGEACFDGVDLAERDRRELNELGFGNLRLNDYIDIEMINGTGADKLESTLWNVAENSLPFEIQNGDPLGISHEINKHVQEM